LKNKIFMFSNIIPEPSMSQQCTLHQKNCLNLTYMALFHHFCLKQLKIGQILYDRGGQYFFRTLYFIRTYLFLTIEKKNVVEYFWTKFVQNFHVIFWKIIMSYPLLFESTVHCKLINNFYRWKTCLTWQHCK